MKLPWPLFFAALFAAFFSGKKVETTKLLPPIDFSTSKCKKELTKARELYLRAYAYKAEDFQAHDSILREALQELGNASEICPEDALNLRQRIVDQNLTSFNR